MYPEMVPLKMGNGEERFLRDGWAVIWGPADAQGSMPRTASSNLLATWAGPAAPHPQRVRSPNESHMQQVHCGYMRAMCPFITEARQSNQALSRHLT